ncbi:hypothetical protein [Anabaena sp. CA = ATCC 33047]|uniref:hypothetical protein n=1 Tax=Anabaena sp. (strain CA / ATCC 33047) TaxID=52271 RepID=UPI000B3383A6|nr:hypothetical protein [Anabaena sp. CA = ATCC 33047]
MKTNVVSSNINDQLQSSAKLERMYRLCQRYTRENWRYSDNIHVLLQLYSSILVKYRYTSLELAMQWSALLADPTARLHTCNPLQVGSSETIKSSAIVFGIDKL